MKMINCIRRKEFSKGEKTRKKTAMQTRRTTAHSDISGQKKNSKLERKQRMIIYLFLGEGMWKNIAEE